MRIPKTMNNYSNLRRSSLTKNQKMSSIDVLLLQSNLINRKYLFPAVFEKKNREKVEDIYNYVFSRSYIELSCINNNSYTKAILINDMPQFDIFMYIQNRIQNGRVDYRYISLHLYNGFKCFAEERFLNQDIKLRNLVIFFWKY